jgi:hypothetical protein
MRAPLAIVAVAGLAAFGAAYAVESSSGGDSGSHAPPPARVVGRYTPVAVPGPPAGGGQLPDLRPRRKAAPVAAPATPAPAPTPTTTPTPAPRPRQTPVAPSPPTPQAPAAPPSNPAPQGDAGRPFFGSR